MNKRSLAAELADKLGIRHYLAYTFIELLLEVMSDALHEGEKIVLSNFGTLLVKKRKAKRVLNPVTHQPMFIPPTSLVKFIPAGNLRRLVDAHDQSR
jgi:nucleoid DNA-binding protein